MVNLLGLMVALVLVAGNGNRADVRIPLGFDPLSVRLVVLHPTEDGVFVLRQRDGLLEYVDAHGSRLIANHGQGPGELQHGNAIRCDDQWMFVFELGAMLRFDRLGAFRDETAISTGFTSLQPLPDGGWFGRQLHHDFDRQQAYSRLVCLSPNLDEVVTVRTGRTMGFYEFEPVPDFDVWCYSNYHRQVLIAPRDQSVIWFWDPKTKSVGKEWALPFKRMATDEDWAQQAYDRYVKRHFRSRKESVRFTKQEWFPLVRSIWCSFDGTVVIQRWIGMETFEPWVVHEDSVEAAPPVLQKESQHLIGVRNDVAWILTFDVANDEYMAVSRPLGSMSDFLLHEARLEDDLE